MAPRAPISGRIPEDMRRSYTAQHNDHITERPFDDVVRDFETRVGSVEDGDWSMVMEGIHDLAEFERRVRLHEKSSGFMRFFTVDHGAWMRLDGTNVRARVYTIGNPLIARTMLRHGIAAGLYVPLRLIIYEETPGGPTHLAYDLPSYLMSVFQNAEITAAARNLDAKLTALALDVTGVEA